MRQDVPNFVERVLNEAIAGDNAADGVTGTIAQFALNALGQVLSSTAVFFHPLRALSSALVCVCVCVCVFFSFQFAMLPILYSSIQK